VVFPDSSAHIAGLGSLKYGIAINNDPDTNIFRVTHYGIFGDFRKVVRAIIEIFRRLAFSQIPD